MITTTITNAVANAVRNNKMPSTDAIKTDTAGVSASGLTALSNDVFVPSVQFGASRTQKLETNNNLAWLLYMLGNDKDGVAKDIEGIKVAKQFAPEGTPTELTYQDLFKGVISMAGGYEDLGLGPGSKIGLAETNTIDFLTSYFGGLAIEATVAPINILALADEETKIGRLVHMLATPKIHSDSKGRPDKNEKAGMDAFVIGADPAFDDMNKGAKVAAGLKKSFGGDSVFGKTIGRVLSTRATDKLLHRLASKSEKIDSILEMAQGFPSGMKIVTPAKKTKLMKSKTFHPSNLDARVAKESVADVIFTSGTTSNPKGVVLTHENLTFTTTSLAKKIESMIGADDKILLGLPMFHIFGKAVMLSAFARQLELAQQETPQSLDLVLLPSLREAMKNMGDVVQTIEDNQITLLPAVPQFLDGLVEYLEANPTELSKIKSLKRVVFGGEALSTETYNKLKALSIEVTGLAEGTGIHGGYGSSEGGINMISLKDSANFVGETLPGVETMVVKESSEDDRGELWVRSKGVAQRYARGTVPKGKEAITDEDGWYHTGDIVAFNREQGYQIVGRDTFFIKRNSEKRSPAEFEEVIKRVMPSIGDVMVVPYAAGTTNERAFAVVASTDSSVTEESIKATMKALSRSQDPSEKIPGWSVPEHVVVINSDMLPERLVGGFKRDGGYKIVRDFVEDLANENAIKMTGSDYTDAATQVLDQAKFDAILERHS